MLNPKLKAELDDAQENSTITYTLTPHATRVDVVFRFPHTQRQKVRDVQNHIESKYKYRTAIAGYGYNIALIIFLDSRQTEQQTRNLCSKAAIKTDT
jgi:hypothetical protein